MEEIQVNDEIIRICREIFIKSTAPAIIDSIIKEWKMDKLAQQAHDMMGDIYK